MSSRLLSQYLVFRSCSLICFGDKVNCLLYISSIPLNKITQIDAGFNNNKNTVGKICLSKISHIHQLCLRTTRPCDRKETEEKLKRKSISNPPEVRCESISAYPPPNILSSYRKKLSGTRDKDPFEGSTFSACTLAKATADSIIVCL